MIWLMGHKGMLGSELARLLTQAGMPFIGTDVDVDITVPEDLRRFAQGRTVDWIVCAAAYTNVDAAEQNEEHAWAINATGAGNIATVAAAIGAPLIHISTDYVFDGAGTRPYTEDDPVRPLGVYARSKAEGERRVRQVCPRHFILRTAWLYGHDGRNFVTTMLRLMRERERIAVVADQRGSPTWTHTLAAGILRIIQPPSDAFGTYHLTDAGDISWYEFALEIQKQATDRGLVPGRCRIDPIPATQYPSRVPRPAYSVLSKEKWRRQFGVTLPDWRVSLGAFLDREKG